MRGERDPRALADLAIGKASAKIVDLREALVGRFDDHHAVPAGQALAHIDTLDAQIAAFDQRIEVEIAPFRRQLARLITIPGVSTRIAQILIPETGADMHRFASAAALASWAGVAPGKRVRNPGRCAAAVEAGKMGGVRPGRRSVCDASRARESGWRWGPLTGAADCCFEHVDQTFRPVVPPEGAVDQHRLGPGDLGGSGHELGEHFFDERTQQIPATRDGGLGNPEDRPGDRLGEVLP
jgi:hypothetical protein